MSCIIHRLELHRDIALPPEGPAADGTTAIYEYRSRVRENDLEPDPSDHLAEGKPVTVIPAGTYLFAQETLGPAPTAVATGLPAASEEARIRSAAEAVWLESIWRETRLKNDRILVRILSEDSKTVFQIFREIAG